MIAEQVRFDPAREPPDLYGQALDALRRERVTTQGPLDPVDDSERRGVRLPPGAARRRILAHPASQQLVMPGGPARRVTGVEVVEVVEMVAPQPAEPGIVPAVFRQLARVVEELEAPRSMHAGGPLGTGHPGARCGVSAGGRGPQIHARTGQPEPDSPVQLDRLQVADGIPVQCYAGHAPFTGAPPLPPRRRGSLP